MLLRNHAEALDELRKRLGRVVYAATDIGTLRAEISDPQQGLMETASLCSCQASDHEFAVVPAPSSGADVPGGVVAVMRAPTRGGSAV
jgi:hypothetical protein